MDKLEPRCMMLLEIQKIFSRFSSVPIILYNRILLVHGIIKNGSLFTINPLDDTINVCTELLIKEDIIDYIQII